MKIIEKISQNLTIKNVSYPTFFLNITSIILGILYVTIPIYSIMWDIFGVILIINLFSNLLLIYLNFNKVNKTTSLGKKIHILSYIFIGITMVAMLAMSQGISSIGSTYSNGILANLFSYVLIYFSYFGLLGFGAFMAILNIKNLNHEEIWDMSNVKSTELSKGKKILRDLFLTVVYYIGFLGGLVAYGSISGAFEPLGWAISAGFNSNSLFLCFISLAFTIFLLTLWKRKKSPRAFNATLITGLIITGIFLTPLLLTPLTTLGAEYEFSIAFGSDWRNKIYANDPYVERNYFLTTPFSIPGYFLGIPPKDCTVIDDVYYYHNDTEGLTLRFDAYIPPAPNLPGMNSTIITIHGGGWTAGNKGQGSMIQRAKYFASQGYCVFDIEYGLYPTSSNSFIPTDPDTVANISITIDDMVRQIGNFTHYLAANASLYGANLSRVFVSGDSAGGHLSMATALGIWSGDFTHYFNDTLTIKGMVPFYPANGLSDLFGVTGNATLVRPETMINSTAPPCLIYQGMSDVFCVQVTLRVQATYRQAGSKCAVVWLPFGGHASDIYFSGYLNMPFLYYMERFLYLCVYDLI